MGVSDRDAPRRPAQFGRYRIRGKLASGGMAEVYRAELVTASGISKPVVIKKVLRSHAQDPAFKAMFLEEARIAARLTHGNIAQVLDAGEIDGEPFIALEFVDGRSFDRILDRVRDLEKRLPPVYAALVIAEVCRGLHYAHTRTDASGRQLGLVHRDISPQNVMVSFDGEVKVVDFGIARAYADPSTRPGLVKTATGAVKGKLSYFAPEQARGEALDARSDVFAAGVVLFEAVCGRLPFHGNPAEILAQVAYGQIPSPNVFVPDLPIELERVIMKALQFDPEERYQSAAQMHDALNRFLARAAPGLGFETLGEVVRLLFEYDIRANAAPPLISVEVRAEVESWPRPGEAAPASEEGSALTAESVEPQFTKVEGESRSKPAPRFERTAQVAAPARPSAPSGDGPWRAWVLVGVAAVTGIPLAAWDVANYGAEPPPPAQVSVAVPVETAPAGDPVLARHIAALPKPSDVVAVPLPRPPESEPPPAHPAPFAPLFGSKPRKDLSCVGKPVNLVAVRRAAAAQAAQARGDAHRAIAEQVAAVATEPSAGALYLTLATRVIDADWPDIGAARALETYLLSCRDPNLQADASLAFAVAAGRAQAELRSAPAAVVSRLIAEQEFEKASQLLGVGAAWPEADRKRLPELRTELSMEKNYAAWVDKPPPWNAAMLRRLRSIPKTSRSYGQAQFMLENAKF